jgi:ParB-like nuclease domain
VKVLLSMVRPNPFRNVDRYPYDPGKIETLRESIRTTGFWDNLLARRVGDSNGGMLYEIAYGHHRLQALRLESGDGDPEVDLTLRNLSDEDMLQIMARENMQEWGTSATVEIETVRAVVTAFAAGRVKLEAPDPKTSRTHMRNAPSFRPMDALEALPEHPYTAGTIAPFLGWTVDKVRDTLGHLELIEGGVLDDAAYRGLSTWQALAMTTEARRLRQAASDRVRQTEAESEEARQRAEQARQEEDAARQLAEQERQKAIAARDEQMAANARLAEDRAKEAWEAAQAARKAHEEDARVKAQEAEAARRQAAESAGEGARAAGEQMRAGAPASSVTKPRKGRQQAAESNGNVMEAKAAEAASLLQRMLKDSDIAEFLTQVTVNKAVVSEESRGVLAGALTAIAEDAGIWRARLIGLSVVVPDSQAATADS